MTVVAVACALTPLAGCSGDSTPPREFMTQVCDGLDDWLQSVLTASERTQRELSNVPSAARGRATLTGFFDTLIEETDRLISAVEAAGAPDVDGGNEAAEAIIRGLTGARRALEDGRDEVQELPDDPARFRPAAAELGQSVKSDLAEVGASLRELEVVELNRAAGQIESCRELGAA